MSKHVLWLASAAIVVGCAWGCSGGGSHTPDLCPDIGQIGVALTAIKGSGGTLRLSTPPDLFAKAHGASVKLEDAVSDWCGAVADVFPPRVTTSDVPLVVSASDTIKIANPLRGQHLVNATVGLEAVHAEPTHAAGLLSWPVGLGEGSSARGVDHNVRFDDGGIAFTTGVPAGRYVATVAVEYPRTGANAPKRRASYTLLIDVLR